MKKKSFIFIFFVQAILCIQYNYEPIEENIPIISSLYLPNSYKIYEYTPFCEEGKYINNTKRMYLDLYFSGTFEFYLYYNYSNIAQDEKQNFINYNKSYYEREDFDFHSFICGKKYYFVLLNDKYPTNFQLLILDEIYDAIQLNPSISQDLNFFPIPEGIITLTYKYKENKRVLIKIPGESKLSILENETNIYINNETDKNEKILNYIFKKNTEYNITFIKAYTFKERPSIYFQFFEDNEYIKPNLTKSSLVLFSNYDYCVELDISNYKIGENIIIFIFGYSEFMIKYQYKDEFNGHNFITAVNYANPSVINYGIIKKEKDCNYLLLYIKIKIASKYSYYFAMELLKAMPFEETKSEGKIYINETNFLFVDYFDFNHYNSFGIYSNQIFYFIEQTKGYGFEITNQELKQMKIIKKDIDSFYYKRNALIIINQFNNENSTIFIEFKKFNFPIASVGEYLHSLSNNINQYLQFYEENGYKNEYYFYFDVKEFIFPIYGNYNTYFIKETDINTLSDLNFNEANRVEHFIYSNYKGYLKIESNKCPAMIQFLRTSYSYYKEELDTGRKYYIKVDGEKTNYINIKSIYINKTISLKFRVLGIDLNESIIMYFDKKQYIINNTSIEINYYYEKYDPELIYFYSDKLYYVEIIVGFLPEDLKSYKIIDFTDSIGKMNNNEGVIIKIPKNFSENLYNYTIIVNNNANNIYINYDKIEFAVPFAYYDSSGMSPFTELFKSNPYLYVSNETNKYFYITILGYDRRDNEIIIKKPFIYDEILEYNKFHIIPKLTGENNKYYYKIKIPKNDANYLSFQAYNGNYFSYISNDYFYRKIEYSKHIDYQYLYNISDISFVNIYDTDIDSYINIAPKKEYNLNVYFTFIKLTSNIIQIEGTNKIKINMTSFSYYNYPKKYKYYLVFNIDSVFSSTYYNTIYQIIIGKIKPDSSLGEKIIILDEDDGSKEYIEYEKEIDIELYSYCLNSYYIIPINIEDNFIKILNILYDEFEFKYIKEEESYILYYIIGFIIIIIVVVIIIIYVKYKKKKEINPNESGLVSEIFEE